MTTRITAAALCCLLLTACAPANWLSERQRDADWNQSGNILNHQEVRK